MTHWRTSRAILGGGDRSPGSLYGATQTRADLNSFYRPLPQGSLHGKNVPDPAIDRSALGFVTTFLIIVAGICIALYFFLRSIGL